MLSEYLKVVYNISFNIEHYVISNYKNEILDKTYFERLLLV